MKIWSSEVNCNCLIIVNVNAMKTTKFSMVFIKLTEVWNLVRCRKNMIKHVGRLSQHLFVKYSY